jgi:penicillin-binding protein 1A
VPFANGGVGISPHVVTRIKTLEGKLLYLRQPDQAAQVIDPRNVAQMNQMMQETLISGTAKKGEIPGWVAAGKTGTSQDFRDAWFIGYTAHLVTGVWFGNDDNSPTRKATGGGLPVEVWSRFMRTAHQGVPIAALPNTYGTGLVPTLAQIGAQITAPLAPAPMAVSPPAANYASGGYAGGGGRAVAPTRGGGTRPEPAAGLDGWLVDRLFGR